MKTGLVIKHTGLLYTVKILESGEHVVCTLRGKMRLADSKATNPVAVGDIADVEVGANKDENAIVDIHDRKNYIIRKPSNLSRQSHVVAANIDRAFLVVTLTLPETKLEFIDRFLVTAEAYHVPVTIVINKTDLYSDAQASEQNQHTQTPKLRQSLSEFKHIYTLAGYDMLEVSTVENKNIDTLREMMRDKVCVLLGNSGVGKSTLINSVDPTQNARTGKISEAHKSGMHTTTFYEMYELAFGGYVIDTPGLKGFGLIDDFSKDEIYQYFPEIFRYSANCKFNPCSHTHEPHCAVREAVERGEIAESRYINYLKIIEDDNTKYRY